MIDFFKKIIFLKDNLIVSLLGSFSFVFFVLCFFQLQTPNSNKELIFALGLASLYTCLFLKFYNCFSFFNINSYLRPCFVVILFILTIYQFSTAIDVNFVLNDTLKIFLIQTSVFIFSIILRAERSQTDKTSAYDFLPEKSSSRSKFIQETMLLLALIAAVLIGIYLRVRDLGKFGFWVDEGISVTVAQRILSGLGQTLPNGAFYPNAFLYEHYLSFCLFLFQNSNIYLISRLANLPFYIGTCLVIYLFGKKIANGTVGTISVFLFSISWLSIDMFQEARFYEFFIFFFFLSIYLSYCFLKQYSGTRGLFNKRNIGFFVAIGICLLISFDSSFLTFLSLYAFSVYFFVRYLQLGNKENFIFLTISILLIIAGVLGTAHNLDEATAFIIFIKPYWLTQSRPILEFVNYFFQNNFYLIFSITATALLIDALFNKKDKAVLYLGSFCIILYFMIALQGYGNSTIRYYYFALPALVLLFGLGTYHLSKVGKNKFSFFILSFLLIINLGLNTYTGFKESNAVNLGVSKIDAKNTNNLVGFQLVKDMYLYKNPTFIVHTQFGTPFEIFFQRLPDYSMDSTALEQDPYLGTKNVDIETASKMHNVVIIYYKNNTPLFNQVDSVLRPYKTFEQNRLVIYYIE